MLKLKQLLKILILTLFLTGCINHSKNISDYEPLFFITIIGIIVQAIKDYPNLFIKILNMILIIIMGIVFIIIFGCTTTQYVPAQQITRGCSLPPRCPAFKLIREGTEWQDLYDNALIGKTCQINLNTYLDCQGAIK